MLVELFINKNAPKIAILGPRGYWEFFLNRQTCIWAPEEYSRVPLRSSEVPTSAQINCGLQNLFPSTRWTLKMAILGAFLKIKSLKKMGCYNIF